MDEQYRNAIGTVESGNNYAAVGPETDAGDRAYGRYQVMGSNIPEWTKKHLGTEMTPEQFLKDKDAQDRVFDGETSAQYKKYGNLDDVTSTWFSGRPVAKAGNASDGYNTTPQYIRKVNAAYDGPTAIDQAMGRRPIGSKQMMGYAASDDDTQPALSSRANLGPGVLGQTGNAAAAASQASPEWAQKLQIIGQTLAEMAPGIAQDPEHAKALEAVAAGGRKVADNGTWSHFVTPNGQLMRIRNKDGMVQQLPGNYAAEKDKKEDPATKAYEVGKVNQGLDLAKELSTNGASSRAALDALVPIQAAISNPNVPQGTMGETRHAANKAALNLPGFDTPELRKTVADTDVAVSGINKMVQEGRTLNGGMPGSLSDKDLVFLKQSQAGLGNTPEANQRIIDIYKQLHQRRIELDNASQAYTADPAHKLGLDDGFKRQMSTKWASENAARDKALAAAEANPPPAAKTAAPSYPKGVRSIELLPSH